MMVEAEKHFAGSSGRAPVAAFDLPSNRKGTSTPVTPSTAQSPPIMPCGVITVSPPKGSKMKPGVPEGIGCGLHTDVDCSVCSVGGMSPRNQGKYAV